MHHLHYLPVILPLLLASCGGGTQEPEAGGPDLVIGESGNATEATSLYQMPTPNELFSIVREMAGEGRKRTMNPAVNADKYTGLGKRAINFGIYSTDLIYASAFDLNVEVVRYYLTVKKLGEELGLTAAFSESDFVRLERNLAHGDSLEIISNDAYLRAYERLQSEEMGSTLALVLAGGWVESMHLVIQQIEVYDPADPLVIRVAEQKVSLEHLIDLMEVHRANADVEPLRLKLMGLRNIYDQLNVRRSVHEGPSSSGRVVLGDDVKVTMTDEQYRQLANAVEVLRNELIQTGRPTEAEPNA